MLHRHAPAGWFRPGNHRADQRPICRNPGGDDHRLRQCRCRGERAQGRRVRLRVQTGGHRHAATSGTDRAETGRGQKDRAAQRRCGQDAWRFPGDRRTSRHDRQTCAQPGAGLHQRRIGRRQGAGRTPDPRAGPARIRAVRAGQLRRNSVRTHGIGILRPQKRILHRRAGRQGWTVPGRERRHAVPRRSRRTADPHAGEAAARDPGKSRAPDRRPRRGAGGRAHPVGHAQESGETGRIQPLPPGSVLPHQRDRTARAAAARTPRRHPQTCRSRARAPCRRRPATRQAHAGCAVRPARIRFSRQRARTGKRARTRSRAVRGEHDQARRPASGAGIRAEGQHASRDRRR